MTAFPGVPSADIPNLVHVHEGPAQEAALILATAPALRDHVMVSDAIDGSDHCVIIGLRPDDVAFSMWGSGAQHMWELLFSITGTSHRVSLYDVIARLDLSNRAAVGVALAALCRPS